MAIAGISAGLAGVTPVARPGAVDVAGLDGLARPADKPFASLMEGLLGEVQGAQGKMDQDVKNLATGKSENVHEIVLNVAQADLMFRMVMEVRDRLISSYQEVMRMQI